MEPAERADRLGALRRTATWVVVVPVVVLAATGAYLAGAYQPKATVAEVWSGGGDDHPMRFVDVVQIVHRWAAWAAVLSSIVVAIVAFVEAVVGWRGLESRRVGVVAGPAIAVATIVGVVSGFLLPWDLMALWSVKVGTNLRGYGWLFDDEVRFVLLGGTEQSVTTTRVAFGVHVVLVSAVLAFALQALVRRDQTRPQQRSTPAETEG